MLMSEVQALHTRCLQASRKGYSIALGDLYAADLKAMAGGVDLPQGAAPGSAEHLVALCDAVLNGGGKKAAKAKPEAKPEPVKAEPPKAPEPPPVLKVEEAVSVEVAEDSVPPYEEWTKAELAAEAEARNIEGSAKMNKEKLLAALHADDAAQAGA